MDRLQRIILSSETDITTIESLFPTNITTTTSSFDKINQWHHLINSDLQIPLQLKCISSVYQANNNIFTFHKASSIILLWSTAILILSDTRDGSKPSNHLMYPLLMNQSDINYNYHPNQDNNNCFIVSTQLYPRPSHPIQHLDNYISSIDNLIFELYKSKTLRGGLRSRQHLLIKIILNYHNLSVSNCKNRKSSTGQEINLDIDFAVDTNKNSTSLNHQIFDPWETYSLRFTFIYRKEPRSPLGDLVGPIGSTVLFITAISFPVLLFILLSFSYVSHHFSGTNSSVSFISITSSLLRPLLDQCEEEELPSNRSYFRLILAPWLFYCLLLSETYRSELRSHMMKPMNKRWLRTYGELVNDSTFQSTTVTFFSDRRGQQFEPQALLGSEFHLTNPGRRKTILDNILQQINYTDQSFRNRNHDDLVREMNEGKTVILGDSFVLQVFSEMSRIKLGTKFYQVSMEGIDRKVLWSVTRRRNIIIRTLVLLRDAGVLSYLSNQQDWQEGAQLKNFVRHRFFMEKDIPDLVQDVRRKDEVLGLKHVESVGYILSGGLFASTCILLLENILRYTSVFWNEFFCSKTISVRISVRLPYERNLPGELNAWI
jgi:hypothetical protein